MFPVKTQKLINNVLSYAVTLSTEMHIMFPQYDNSNEPSPEEIAMQNRILCYVINNKEIPDGYSPLIANTLYAIADHLEAVDFPDDAFILITAMPELRNFAKQLDLMATEGYFESPISVLEAAT